MQLPGSVVVLAGTYVNINTYVLVSSPRKIFIFMNGQKNMWIKVCKTFFIYF